MSNETNRLSDSAAANQFEAAVRMYREQAQTLLAKAAQLAAGAPADAAAAAEAAANNLRAAMAAEEALAELLAD